LQMRVETLAGRRSVIKREKGFLDNAQKPRAATAFRE